MNLNGRKLSLKAERLSKLSFLSELDVIEIAKFMYSYYHSK